MSKEEFAHQITHSELGERAAAILWDKLYEVKCHDQFTPYPDDDLLKVYGIADEDLDDDLILNIFSLMKIKTPSEQTLDQTGPIKTSRDIIRLVELCASHDTT